LGCGCSPRELINSWLWRGEASDGSGLVRPQEHRANLVGKLNSALREPHLAIVFDKEPGTD
jgi:hypothetical protein